MTTNLLSAPLYAALLMVAVAGTPHAATTADMVDEAAAANSAADASHAATVKAAEHNALSKDYDAKGKAAQTWTGKVSNDAQSVKHSAGEAWEKTKAGYNKSQAERHTDNVTKGVSATLARGTSSTAIPRAGY
jgi:hypothetical protein